MRFLLFLTTFVLILHCLSCEVRYGQNCLYTEHPPLKKKKMQLSHEVITITVQRMQIISLSGKTVRVWTIKAQLASEFGSFLYPFHR